jgi:hypothetical protein
VPATLRAKSLAMYGMSRIASPCGSNCHGALVQPREITVKCMTYIPAACAVAVVVEPRAKDEVGRNGEEEAVALLVDNKKAML